jgi:hypothetical protein
MNKHENSRALAKIALSNILAMRISAKAAHLMLSTPDLKAGATENIAYMCNLSYTHLLLQIELRYL